MNPMAQSGFSGALDTGRRSRILHAVLDEQPQDNIHSLTKLLQKLEPETESSYEGRGRDRKLSTIMTSAISSAGFEVSLAA